MTKGSSQTARNDVPRLNPGTQRGGCGKRLSGRDIAEVLNVSPQRVSQLLRTGS
jgi:transcriptional regulator with XRE-family HTH domain